MVKRNLPANTVKKRKRRKPMTEEQRAAAAERLKKAREKRAKENPPEYKSIHPAVLEKGEEHALSLNNVKQWIKTNREKLPALRSSVRMNTKGAIAELNSVQGYIRNMEMYLRTGTWVDLFYGESQQNKIKNVCIAMAYDKHGYPKRNIGTFYPDIGEEWTEEMDKEDRKRRG